MFRLNFLFIAILFTIAFFPATTFSQVNSKITMNNIQSIGEAVEDYAVQMNKYPGASNINEVIKILETENSKHFSSMDQWNHELKYFGTKDVYWIISYGPDGKPDTALYGSDGKPLPFPTPLPDPKSFDDIILINGDFLNRPPAKSDTCRLISTKEMEDLIGQNVSLPSVEYSHGLEPTYYGQDMRTACRIDWPGFHMYLKEHDPAAFCEQQYLRQSEAESLSGIGERAVWNEVEPPNLVIIQGKKCLEISASGYSKYTEKELKELLVKTARIILPRI